MKSPFLIFGLASLLAIGSVARATDLGQHVYFKHLVGSWKAEGELKGENNNVVKITEEWTGKADADDSFFIEGTRTTNGDTQPFKWTMTHNPTTDGYEVILTGAEGSQPIRFEGSLSEVEMTMTFKAIGNSGGANITMVDSFVDEKKDTLQSKVTLLGDQGQITLEGTIIHKREKKP